MDYHDFEDESEMTSPNENQPGFLQRTIPGHFRAYTLWLLLLVAGGSLVLTRDWAICFAFTLIILGGFLGDQATHLGQAAHSAPPPTVLEQMLQTQRWLWTVTGFFMAFVGLTVIASRIH
jgi:hypothetical protein